jgi:DNA polymerase-1
MDCPFGNDVDQVETDRQSGPAQEKIFASWKTLTKTKTKPERNDDSGFGANSNNIKNSSHQNQIQKSPSSSSVRPVATPHNMVSPIRPGLRVIIDNSVSAKPSTLQSSTVPPMGVRPAARSSVQNGALRPPSLTPRRFDPKESPESSPEIPVATDASDLDILDDDIERDLDDGIAVVDTAFGWDEPAVLAITDDDQPGVDQEDHTKIQGQAHEAAEAGLMIDNDAGDEDGESVEADPEIDASPWTPDVVTRDLVPGTFRSASDLPTILTDIEESEEVAIACFSTGPVPVSYGNRSRKIEQILGVPVKEYHESMGVAAAFNSDARLRILAIRVESGVCHIIDFDDKSWGDQKSADRSRLIQSLSGKIWVGHNLTQALVWLTEFVRDVRPLRLIDTALIAQILCPDIVIDAHEAAVTDLESEAPDSIILNTLASRKGQNKGDSYSVPFSLIAALHLGRRHINTVHNDWSVRTLSHAHQSIATRTVIDYAAAARIMMGCPERSRVVDLLKAIDSHETAWSFHQFEKSIPGLVAMRKKGVYFDRDAATKVVENIEHEIAYNCDVLIEAMPSIEPFRTNLMTNKISVDVKNQICQAFAEKTGVALPKSKDGKTWITSAKQMILTYGNAPFACAWIDLHSALVKRNTIQDLIDRTSTVSDSRLRSLFMITTVSGRVTSRDPQLHSIPDVDFIKSLFCAPPPDARGVRKIASMDFTAIEMVMAAGLAERCHDQMAVALQSILVDLKSPGRAKVRTGRYDRLGTMGWMRWLLESSNLIQDYLIEWDWQDDYEGPIREPLPKPDVENGFKFEEWAAYRASQLVSWIDKVRRKGGFRMNAPARLTMSSIFKEGVDPHLVTAIESMRRAGMIDLAPFDSAIEWLGNKSFAERESLKEEFKDYRRKSKATNFGVIYGMQVDTLHAHGITDFGLTWSRSDAEEQFKGWFETYPEIGLWQCVTQIGGKHRTDRIDLASKSMISKKNVGQFFIAHTISGRKIVADRLTAALSYQDQGSAAEMTAAVFSGLFDAAIDPEKPNDSVGSRMILFIHDEFVFEDYEHEIDKTMKIAYNTAMRISNEYTKAHSIPVNLSCGISNSWQH